MLMKACPGRLQRPMRVCKLLVKQMTLIRLAVFKRYI
jgi:hypothetical protein